MAAVASDAADPLEQALRGVGELLGSLPARSMLIGGMAVIANGHIRTTDDVDATVAGGAVSAREILDRAATFGIVPRIPDPLAFAERNQILLLVHRSSGVEIDLSLAWLPFEEQALERSLSVAFHGVTIRICHPEDLVVYKLVAARALDLEDARQLTLLHHHTIDRRRVSEALREFDEVLEDGRSRVELWQQIARSAYPA